ncbi:MAG: NAD-dependent epimerase/dehydratase family protein [Vicinamibacterales bacterium]
MRVLVTGGTGYLGRAVVRALTAAGHEPVVLAREASRSGLPARTIDADIRDAAAIDRAAEGCDVICHLAALVALWRARREDFDEVNVGGLRNVLEVTARRGLRLIHTSSFLALPPSGRSTPIVANDYQRTKVIAEREADAAAKSGASIVRLYPGVIYGPGVASEGNLVGRLVEDHLAGRLPGIVGANRIWSCAWIEDVAEAHVRAAERAAPGSAYALGGENLPLMRVFEIVEAHTRTARPHRIPSGVATAIGAVEEARARLFHSAPLLTRGAVEIFGHDWPLDSHAAQRDLGYHVRPLAQGMERLLASRTAGKDDAR